MNTAEAAQERLHRLEKKALQNNVNDNPLISIVILNFNAREFSERCLSSVLRTDYPNFEVIFVDNASSDGSVEQIKRKFSYDGRFEIVANERNYGPAQGNNVGARHADPKAKYLVFLNNDTEVDPHWLRQLINAIDRDETIGAAGCKQLLMANNRMIDVIGTQIDSFGFLYPQGRLELDDGQYDEGIREIFTYGSTALIVRKHVFSRVGGFDLEFFGWYEDNDLCWRIRLAGFRIVSVPKARIYHAVSGSFRKLPKYKSMYYAERNKITTLIKNYDSFSLLSVMPIVTFFAVCQIVVFSLVKKAYHARAIAKALLWNVMNFRNIWIKHLSVQHEIRTVSDREIKMCMERVNPMKLLRKARTI